MFIRRLQNNISNGTCKEAHLNLTTTFNAKTKENVLTKSNKLCYTKKKLHFHVIKLHSNDIINYSNLLNFQMTNTREMQEIHAYHAKDIITIEDSEDEKVNKFKNEI